MLQNALLLVVLPGGCLLDWSTLDAGPEDVEAVDAAQRAEVVWVPIPGGTFEMGCSPGDLECADDEEPRHRVTVGAFFMTATEVTQVQYEQVTGSNPSFFTGCPDCPVESVTWHEATAFCSAVGGRLPTEAEWEYAARAGTTSAYYCGDVSCLDEIAWYDQNSNGRTQPVAGKAANPHGLFDMLGNVWEKTFDWYGESYYASSPQQDPLGPERGDHRVLRGGAYAATYLASRASQRYKSGPDFSSKAHGFRCARDAR